MSRLRILSVVATVILCTFLTALDNTVVNVALPRMRAELALSESDVKWVATGYPLALASFLLLGGQLTDTRGRRWTLLTGLTVFTASSAGCALSATAAMLVCFRCLQGVGAALILPACLALMSHELPRHVRAAGFAATTATLASALALGPVISGVVTQHLGWEWLFVMNVPLGFAGLLVGALAVPVSPLPERGSRARSLAGLPSRVIALACVSLAAIVYCLIQGPSYGFTDPFVIISGIAAVTGALTLCCGKKFRRGPKLGELFRQRPFKGGLISQLLWGLGVSGVYFYTSQFLQNGLRLSPTEAGLTFTPVASALVLTAPFVTALARRWGDGRVSAAGLLLVALGLLLVAMGSVRGALVGLLPGLASVGVGSALAIPLTTRALESSPRHLSGVAAGLFSATREMSGVFGIALMGAVVTFVQRRTLSAGTSHDTAFLVAYQAGLCIAAALVGAGAPVAVWALRHPREPAREGCGLSKPSADEKVQARGGDAARPTVEP
ncbi:MFS transporter [Streptomyces sp. ME18-1-4]|uniref:MFS transporter n=1 Tax=Streptomyces sp. ME18-1-4 TaxID=3028685 RepID=UPI0029A2F9F8|nr:MFS transporter [Streptomyces sp. ME18-1-4]MDX3244108.1 MFS transporter [Streptomyces sp. ME18-1-4]